jgi:hypothetical protein
MLSILKQLLRGQALEEKFLLTAGNSLPPVAMGLLMPIGMLLASRKLSVFIARNYK